MGNLHALAISGEQYGVITNHITSTHRGKANGLPITRTGLALTTVDRYFLQVAPQRLGNHLAHAQGGTRRRVHLVAMVRLDDFDIDLIAQHPRSGVEQFQAQVDTHAEVGREDDRDFLASVSQELLLLHAETGGTDNHGLASLAAERQILQSYRRMGEVDQNIEFIGNPLQVTGQRHTNAPDCRQLTSVSPHQRTVRTINRRCQTRTRRLLNSFDQGLAHAPCSAHHSYTSHALLPFTNRRRNASHLRTSHWPWVNASCRLQAKHGTLPAVHAGDD
ncbi:hypothetical protein D9M71_411910 [compost metagenome]